MGVRYYMLMFWDEPKRESNIKIHSLDFADAQDRFEWAGALVGETYAGKDGRGRFIAVGFLDGTLVSLIFSPLGTEAVSLISLRPASRSERKLYDRS